MEQRRYLQSIHCDLVSCWTVASVEDLGHVESRLSTSPGGFGSEVWEFDHQRSDWSALGMLSHNNVPSIWVPSTPINLPPKLAQTVGL